MVLKIRLARFGRHALPFYRIVVANARAPRDGKHIEQLGSYNPMPDKFGVKKVICNVDRAKYWISVGAQPTDRVAKLLGLTGLLPLHPKTTAAAEELASVPQKLVFTSDIKLPKKQ